MKKIKIVTIGGGSSYTPELIEGFIIRKDKLPISEIVLVDVEEGKEKLEIVGEMAKRMVKAAGLDWTISLSLDRKTALKDADYVTTQLRVGLLDARIRDERIPLKYGMLGQETNGAGGILKAFRTIPVILDIVAEMKEQCPNAWLVNFTNPAGMVTEAAINIGGWKRTIGLCNVPIGVIKMTNSVFGYDLFDDTLFYKFAGLNHFHWHRVWDKSGKELTAELIDKMYDPASEFNKSMMANIKGIQFNLEQLQATKLLPCFYHRYYYVTQDMLDSQLEEFKENKTRAEEVKRTEASLFELYKDVNLDHKPEELAKRGGAHYSDAACDLISAIHNDSRAMMVVNTENRGAILDLPYDSVVEISSIITAHGPEPLTWGGFEPAIRGSLQLQKAMEDVVIEAAVTGCYNTALQAFTMNPLVNGGKVAKEMLNEMLIENRDYLPQFKDVIQELMTEKV